MGNEKKDDNDMTSYSHEKEKSNGFCEKKALRQRQGGLKKSFKYSSSLCSIESSSSEEILHCKSVAFTNISVRNYNITLGDHPDCSYGPPICLSWDFEDYGEIKLIDYELSRPPRRSPRQMLITIITESTYLLNLRVIRNKI